MELWLCIRRFSCVAATRQLIHPNYLPEFKNERPFFAIRDVPCRLKKEVTVRFRFSNMGCCYSFCKEDSGPQVREREREESRGKIALLHLRYLLPYHWCYMRDNPWEFARLTRPLGEQRLRLMNVYIHTCLCNIYYFCCIIILRWRRRWL